MCFVIFVLRYCSRPQKHPVCRDLEDKGLLSQASAKFTTHDCATASRSWSYARWELPWYGEATPPASYLAYLLSALKPSSSHFKRKVSAFSAWSWTAWKAMSTSTSSTASLFVKWRSEWTDFLRLGPRNRTDDEFSGEASSSEATFEMTTRGVADSISGIKEMQIVFS